MTHIVRLIVGEGADSREVLKIDIGEAPRAEVSNGAPAPARFQPVQSKAEAVVDTKTGLMWSRTLDKELTHAAAEKACRELRVGGFDDWRLPTCEELLTLVDRSRHEPAIDVAAFPDTKSTWYWTSTPAAWNASSDAWIVYFYYGSALTYNRDYDARVRAVRVAAPASQ